MNGDQAIPEFYQELYEENIQDLFYNRTNKLLEAFQPKMLQQWESLKIIAIENGFNDDELYPISSQGISGFIFLQDFMNWLLSTWKMKNFLRDDVTQEDIIYILTTNNLTLFASLSSSSLSLVDDQRSLNNHSGILSAGNGVEEEKANPTTADTYNNNNHNHNKNMKEVDLTILQKRMNYDDFMEFICRLWQSELVILPSNGGLLDTGMMEQPTSPTDNNNNNNATTSSRPTPLPFIGHDFGSVASSSIVENNLLHKLLYWLKEL
jgi:hypothetical protein